jgi:hypothetical protein
MYGLLARSLDGGAMKLTEPSCSPVSSLIPTRHHCVAHPFERVV